MASQDINSEASNSTKNSKRQASSPIQNSETDKRQCLDDSNASMEGILHDNEEILFLKFKQLLEIESQKIVANLSAQIASLQDQLTVKDTIIANLEQKIDDMEQHGRQMNVRINGVPEDDNEDTDQLVVEIAKSIGAKVSYNDICRSHRLGKKNSEQERAIIVRFATYRAKSEMNKHKKNLKQKKMKDIFPNMPWPPTNSNIFINDDLTKKRSMLAFEARQKKKRDEIKETWIANGKIVIRKNDSTVVYITKKSELLRL